MKDQGNPPPRPAPQPLEASCGNSIHARRLDCRLGTVSGVDISTAMIERAQAANPRVNYRAYGGSRLPYPDESFDLVFAVCVVHHVPPSSWPRFVNEMARVTRRRGIVAIAEHNP